MKSSQKVFASAIAGNVLEYYDFTVYAVFSAYIGQTFFPAHDSITQLLYSLGVFAVGFAMRPIGGIVFGYIGDKHGRRISLIISMLGMTIPTFSIGLLPGYNEIGIWAPAILVLFRLIQGLCISGEGAGAAIFVLEHIHNFRPGFITGFVHGSNIAGSIFAHFIAIYIAQNFAGYDFAWRFAFILGGFLGIVGFYFRLRVSETPIFKEMRAKKKTTHLPFINVVKNAWRYMLITFFLGGVASSIVYLVKTYVLIFYENILHYNREEALFYSLYGLAILMVSMPFFGYMADIFGKKRIIQFSCLAITTLATPALYLMGSDSWFIQVSALTILACLGGAISGTAYIFIISLFQPAERFTGVAFSYNFGIAMCGPTSAMVATWLANKTNLFYAPAFHISLLAFLFFLATITVAKDALSKVDV